MSRLAFAAVLLLALVGAGCSHKKPAEARLPAPPPIDSSASRPPAAAETRSDAATRIPDNAKPIYVETGMASWYGPPYHNRVGANGEVYDMNQLTAAHRTLPLNSIARVTNVATGSVAMVRITDRGPFIEGRILDLSMAAAKAVDVWRPGTAMVKLEVMHAPVPIDQGGRWCVQIGAFTNVREANKLRDQLARRYHTAKVLEFTGPTGEWVRVRVLEDDKKRAEALAEETETSQGAVFLVRLD